MNYLQGSVNSVRGDRGEKVGEPDLAPMLHANSARRFLFPTNSISFFSPHLLCHAFLF